MSSSPPVASLPTILKTEGDFSFGPNDKVAEITIGSDVTVYPGTKLTIRCPVESTGSILVFWTSRGRPVNIGNAQRVGNDLVITDIDKRYALEYECTARAARAKVSEKSTVRVKGVVNLQTFYLIYVLSDFFLLHGNTCTKLNISRNDISGRYAKLRDTNMSNNAYLLGLNGRRSGVEVSAPVSESNCLGSSPGRRHCVVS